MSKVSRATASTWHTPGRQLCTCTRRATSRLRASADHHVLVGVAAPSGLVCSTVRVQAGCSSDTTSTTSLHAVGSPRGGLPRVQAAPGRPPAGHQAEALGEGTEGAGSQGAGGAGAHAACLLRYSRHASCCNQLLPLCLDPVLEMRHGAMVAVAQLLPALAAGGEKLSSERQVLVAGVVPAVEQSRLLRGKGGELMREAVCKLVHAQHGGGLPAFERGAACAGAGGAG
jgi:hypothetical protein